jgi:hypothetical protein
MKQAVEDTARTIADENSVQSRNNGAKALADEAWGMVKPSKGEAPVVKGEIKDGGVKGDFIDCHKGEIKDGGVKGEGKGKDKGDQTRAQKKDKEMDLLERAQEKIDSLVKMQAILEEKLAILQKKQALSQVEQPFDLGPIKDDVQSATFKTHKYAHSAKPDALESSSTGSSASERLPGLEIIEEHK